MKHFNKEMRNSNNVFEIHNSFNVFMQTLNVDEVCQVRVKSRNFNFTQTLKNNTKSPCPKQKRN